MATAIARAQSSDCSNPVLVHLSTERGFLREPAQLEFEIYDISTPAKRLTPSHVFPVGGGRHTVNLTDCPTGDKLSTGRFVARYDVDAAEPLGDHKIIWYEVPETGADEVQYEQEFAVLPVDEVALPGMYCTISDLRDEGVSEDCDGYDAKRLMKAIIRASKYIERVTGRFFEPRYITQHLNGHGSPILFFGDPVIAVESVEVNTFPFDPQPDFIFSNESIRVYNRHIADNLLNPDDRDNPKVEIFRGPRHFISGDHDHHFVHQTDFTDLQFPKGQKNVVIAGVFGYTEPDGSTVGTVPDEIRHCCALLTLRSARFLTDEDRESDNAAYRITMERTRQQAISFAAPTGRAGSMTFGYFSGDPEIDAILAAFMRPPALGAA
jgi:hypothetical protein